MERYRIGEGYALYYVTFTVVEWLPVFVSAAACEIVTESLSFCHAQKSLRTNAFVIMPTHLHAILFDAELDTERLQRTLAELRRFTGHRLADHCAEHLPPCFGDVLRSTGRADRDRIFWQPTRHPEAIGTEAFLREKQDYVHANPCRKGLVRRPDQWRFSSAAYWLSEGTEETDVPLTAVDW